MPIKKGSLGLRLLASHIVQYAMHLSTNCNVSLLEQARKHSFLTEKKNKTKNKQKNNNKKQYVSLFFTEAVSDEIISYKVNIKQYIIEGFIRFWNIS